MADELGLPLSEQEYKQWSAKEWFEDGKYINFDEGYLEYEEQLLKFSVIPKIENYLESKGLNPKHVSDDGWAFSALKFMEGLRYSYNNSDKMDKQTFALVYTLATNTVPENEGAIAEGVKYGKFLNEFEKTSALYNKLEKNR